MTGVDSRRTFVTAAHARREWVDGQLINRPAADAHLKEVGTNLTLCGAVATTWQVFWEIDVEHCAALCGVCAASGRHRKR